MDDAEDEIRSSEKAGFRYEKRAMTKHPVIEALNTCSKAMDLCDIAEVRAISRNALPLAQELVEKAEALEWMYKFWPVLFDDVADDDDCPAVIKKMLEETR